MANDPFGRGSVKYFWLLAGATAIAGCSGGGARLGADSAAVKVASDLPLPDRQSVAQDVSDYRLGPTDEIVVSVFNAPELGKEGRVDAAGNFALPLVGNVRAGGLTPDEMAVAVADKLRGRYLKDPQVSVNIKQARSAMVTVDGAVREPGLYPVIGGMTLQQALASAKGASEAANIDRVIVFRQVDGQKMAAMFDLTDIRSGRTPDPAIYGNDIVVVGENAARKFLRDAQWSLPLLARFVPVL